MEPTVKSIRYVYEDIFLCIFTDLVGMLDIKIKQEQII